MSTNIATLTKEQYTDVDRWVDFFNQNKHIKNIPYDATWYAMFKNLMASKSFEKINNDLKELVEQNNKIKIYPHPSYLFSAFLATPANNVKVVFIGQDPYFNCDAHNGKYVPQAMGLSFSVPHNVDIPSSLNNVYANMIKYGHLKEKPVSGNLWFWAYQGCLMLNAALTVEDGLKKSHDKMWKTFTSDIVRYIAAFMKNVVFVLWGADAYAKYECIKAHEKKHLVITSSHPSGLSAHKVYGKFPAFMDEDHFGKINEYLEKHKRGRILWI